MRSLRETLKQKFEQQPSSGIRLSFRLPDSSKVYAVFNPSNSCLVTMNFFILRIDYLPFPQELYKLVFAKTKIVSPYYFLYTMSLWHLISPDCAMVVSQLDLNGSVLVVQENEDAPDPLMLFDEVLTD